MNSAFGITLAIMVVVTSANIVKRSSQRSCTVNGNEYDHGTTFTLPDYSDCFVYTCDDGSSSLIEHGCEDSEGNCRDVGETWDVGCVTYTCANENNVYSIRIQALACTASDGSCKPVGTSWTSNCKTYQCSTKVVDGKTHIVTSISSVQCKDADNVCRTESETFPFVIQGTRYESCTCTITGTSIGYTCSA